MTRRYPRTGPRRSGSRVPVARRDHSHPWTTVCVPTSVRSAHWISRNAPGTTCRCARSCRQRTGTSRHDPGTTRNCSGSCCHCTRSSWNSPGTCRKTESVSLTSAGMQFRPSRRPCCRTSRRRVRSSLVRRPPARGNCRSQCDTRRSRPQALRPHTARRPD